MNVKGGGLKFGLSLTAVSIFSLAWFATPYRFFNSVEYVLGQPLRHDAYIWQRLWNHQLAESISKSKEMFSSFNVLYAEVSWHKKSPRVTYADIDLDSLGKRTNPVAISLRVNPYSGPFDENDVYVCYFSEILNKGIKAFEAGGVRVDEVQIDFDCATANLDGYASWIRGIGQRLPDVRLSITTLPTWMNSRDFDNLVNETDGYVLQVHSLERPTTIDKKMTICDTANARKWIEKAAKYGVPFKVALPTYGYVVRFDSNGTFKALSAEDAALTSGEDELAYVVESDSYDITRLVSDLKDRRPLKMVGVIWYRLPVKSDKLNWSWETLTQVIKGEAPKTSLSVSIEKDKSGLFDVQILNSGSLNVRELQALEVECSSPISIAEGVGTFNVVQEGRRLTFVPKKHGTLDILLPGVLANVGWFRASPDADYSYRFVYEE